MKYLLDTNVIAALEKDPQGPIHAMILTRGIGNIATSIVVAGEIEFGIAKRKSISLAETMGAVLASIVILPIEPPVEREYGRLRAELEREGTPIGSNDMWIAAHALALDLILVTDNEREFQRVDGLRIENWVRS